MARRHISICWLGLLGCAAASHAVAEVSIRPLDPLPGEFASQAHGLSGNGTVIVGRSLPVGAIRAVRWNSQSMPTDLGLLSGMDSADARAASADGGVIVGNSWTAFGYAYRWTAAEGMTNLGAFAGDAWSSAHAVSGDGLVVVGSSTLPSGLARAARWSVSDGWSLLGPMLEDSSASGISSDGTVVVGRRSPTPGESVAFRWTQAGGMTALGSLDVGHSSSAAAASANGAIVVGSSGLGTGQRAFRWTQPDGMSSLGTLGGDYSAGIDVSDDGAIIVGQTTTASGSYRAFLWTEALGMVDLSAFLSQRGVDMTGWMLQSATGVSADGYRIVGEGVYNGQPRGFAATIPAPPAGVSGILLVLIAMSRRRGHRWAAHPTAARPSHGRSVELRYEKTQNR